MTFEGLNIRSALDIHGSYMYTINDAVVAPIYYTDEEADTPRTKMSKGYMGSGFYVYDINMLVKGKLEVYKMCSAIGGVSNFIDNSKFSDRFSFISDFSNITVIPFPHLNLINCVGMN